MAVLKAEIVFKANAPAPVAVLSLPDVFEVNAPAPVAVFPEPVRVKLPAPFPRKKFDLPVALEIGVPFIWMTPSVALVVAGILIAPAYIKRGRGRRGSDANFASIIDRHAAILVRVKR